VADAITVEGAVETEHALSAVADDLKPGGAVDAEAGNAVAELLAPALVAAALASGVPVAPRVARSIRITPGARPTVSIGGAEAVGRDGAPAYHLVWGSEHGPAGEPNHFGVPHGPGYWIKPAVDRVKDAQAPAAFDLAIAGRIRRHGL
jgi:hypothetical protein